MRKRSSSLRNFNLGENGSDSHDDDNNTEENQSQKKPISFRRRNTIFPEHSHRSASNHLDDLFNQREQTEEAQIKLIRTLSLKKIQVPAIDTGKLMTGG